MSKMPFFMAASLLMACSGSAQQRGSVGGQEVRPMAPAALITLGDAMKIMGQPAHLADSSTTRSGKVLQYQCAYKANEEEEGSGRIGAIYYMVEEYDQLTAARKKYSSIKAANEDHGIKVLDDLGDEAYFHSDGENFLFIMARKGTRVLIMKVNKITSTTSRDAFNTVARKIVDGL